MTEKVMSIIKSAMEISASDIFIIAGIPVTCKVSGVRKFITDEVLTTQAAGEIVEEIFRIAHRSNAKFLSDIEDDDFSFSLANMARFRVNAFRQRGSFAAVIRIIRFGMPDPTEMGIPDTVVQSSTFKKGLVLVAGPAGSGKSTTLACIVDKINKTRESHIITIEDPIEFLHRHDKAIVTQREIANDVGSYVSALRSALRQSPNVILLGEMRDRETIEVAMTAAETGQLLFGTLHTVSAAHTVDRIIDVFPAEQQQQIRIQLSMVLQRVVSQQLVPGIDGTLIPAFEIMNTNTAIRNLIREAKTHQINSVIASSPDMITMEASLLELVKQNRITKETATIYSFNPEIIIKKLQEL